MKTKPIYVTPEELEALARDVVDNFEGDEYWIFKDEATQDITAFARSIINMVLEDTAVSLEALERGTYTATNTPAQLVRAMKVK